MEQPPREDPRRIVDEEVAGEEEEEGGDGGAVQGKTTRYAPFLPGGMILEPQEQTILRVGQKIRSSRPQAGQPR